MKYGNKYSNYTEKNVRNLKNSYFKTFVISICKMSIDFLPNHCFEFECNLIYE